MVLGSRLAQVAALNRPGPGGGIEGRDARRSPVPGSPFASGREGGVEFGELSAACREARRFMGYEHWVVLYEK